MNMQPLLHWHVNMTLFGGSSADWYGRFILREKYCALICLIDLFGEKDIAQEAEHTLCDKPPSLTI
jgi:hypothetical protein